MFERRGIFDALVGETDGRPDRERSRASPKGASRVGVHLPPERQLLDGGEAREGVLPPPAAAPAMPRFKRFYEPDSVRVMTDALDLACRMLPAAAQASESMRRRLALHIMHDLDAGERDAARLALSAVLSVRI
jgi:hypothetical protein